MILAIDIGNSTIVMGCLLDGKVLFEEKVATNLNKTKIEYAMLVKSMLELNDIFVEDIKGAIISSVVPPLTNLLKAALRQVTGQEALLVGPGINTGLALNMDDPKSVGADLMVAARAVKSLYGMPAIIVDVGTATTVTAIDKDGTYIGGAIMPGLNISMDALVARTAQLPRVSLEEPRELVGKNTIDSMKSGAVYGTACAIDGMIDRFKAELSFGQDTALVATGGLAGLVVKECKNKIIYDDALLLKGLGIIYEMN